MTKQYFIKELKLKSIQLESHRKQIDVIESCFNNYYEIIANSKILEWVKLGELTKVAIYRIMYSNFGE